MSQIMERVTGCDIHFHGRRSLVSAYIWHGSLIELIDLVFCWQLGREFSRIRKEGCEVHVGVFARGLLIFAIVVSGAFSSFDLRIIARTHGLEETRCLYMRSANRAGHHFEEITETTIKSVAERLARFEPKHFRLIVQKIADRLRGKYVPGSLADDSANVGCSRDPLLPQPLSQIPFNWHHFSPFYQCKDRRRYR